MAIAGMAVWGSASAANSSGTNASIQECGVAMLMEQFRKKGAGQETPDSFTLYGLTAFSSSGAGVSGLKGDSFSVNCGLEPMSQAIVPETENHRASSRFIRPHPS